MTVQELINRLSPYKPTALLQFDTGDLCCDSVSVDLFDHRGTVVITRGDLIPYETLSKLYNEQPNQRKE